MYPRKCLQFLPDFSGGGAMEFSNIKDILNLELSITQGVIFLENHKINLLQVYYAVSLPRCFIFIFYSFTCLEI